MISAMNKQLTALVYRHFDKWLSKRMPAKKSYSLSNKIIFIFPTRFGFVFLLFIALLFLLGTNYQNNVIILFSYLLASFFITSMLHSFFNLLGVKVTAFGELSGFAQQSLAVKFKLQSNKKRYGYKFQFPEQTRAEISLIEAGETMVKVPFYAQTRGVVKLKRLKIASEYGFGLFTTWTQLDFDLEAIIYPKPEPIIGAVDLSNQGDEKESNLQNHTRNYQKGNDDFYALKTYQVGDPLTHVAWKQVARGQGWYTKEYQQNPASRVWLSLHQMPGNTVEQKLSMLCYLLLELNQQGIEYGIDLGSVKIAPSDEQAHFKNCLSALAKFGGVNAEVNKKVNKEINGEVNE